MTLVRLLPALRSLGLAVASAGFFVLGQPALANQTDADLAEQDRISELERKVDLLTDELARTRQDMGVPEDKPLESVWGLGPAASKVYGVGRGLSIGGYTEAFYSDVVEDKRKSGQRDTFDYLRAILYVGYKFNDNWIFNAEFEFEHASTSSTEAAGGGSVSVEFATLDYLHRDEINARAGILLVPLGFINELHEPPFFFGNRRPDVETLIIPSTLRENGAGLFGRIAEIVDYRVYAITSLAGEGFGAAGLRGGRQKGNRALADDWSVVGRVDVQVLPELSIGGAVMHGNTGHDRRLTVLPAFGGGSTKLPEAPLTLWEGHAQLNWRGLHARTLFTMAHLGDARTLTRSLRLTGDVAATETISKEMLGWYAEVAYEIFQWIAPESGWTFEPFARFEHVNTQRDVPVGFARDRSRIFDVYTVGFSAKPIPNIVLKLDYRARNPRSGSLGNEINAGFGLVF